MVLKKTWKLYPIEKFGYDGAKNLIIVVKDGKIISGVNYTKENGFTVDVLGKVQKINKKDILYFAGKLIHAGVYDYSKK